MSLFAKALRCLYQDKDAVYLWPEGFAACAAVCTESRASLDDVWTDLGSMTDAYVLRLASALHTDPYIAAMRAAEDSEGEDVSDEGPVQKYEGRGFTFDAAWESKWRAWLATQPPAPTAGEIVTRNVETHPAFVSLRRFWTTGEYEQPAELCNDKSTLYRYVWKL